ncbi:hypothetical protein ACFL59_12780 [Planctomycetota bacterium]
MKYENPIPKLVKHPFRLFAVMRIVFMWIRIYFTTQSEADPAQAEVIETALDERIPPEEEGVYPYLFACVYILYVCWYVMDRLSPGHYRRAARAYSEMIVAAKRVFTERPTRMGNRQRSDHPLLLFTQEVDGPTNCFPSLHVALVTLSYQIVKDSMESEDLLLAAMRRSCVDICRSTLRTKQHSVIDVIGGIELSRKSYLKHFKGAFENLLEEVVPELTPEELSSIAAVVTDSRNLIALQQSLLAQFRAQST